MDDYKNYLDEAIFDIRNGAYSSALEKLNKSITLKNDWEISYFYRAVAHQALENFDDAILDYTKSIQLNPKMTDAYYNRAKIILTRKDIEAPDINKAILDLEKSLELDPNFIDALYAMGAAQKKVENYHKALEYLNRAIELQPEFIHAKALQKLILTKYLKNL